MTRSRLFVPACLLAAVATAAHAQTAGPSPEDPLAAVAALQHGIWTLEFEHAEPIYLRFEARGRRMVGEVLAGEDPLGGTVRLEPSGAGWVALASLSRALPVGGKDAPPEEVTVAARWELDPVGPPWTGRAQGVDWERRAAAGWQPCTLRPATRDERAHAAPDDGQDNWYGLPLFYSVWDAHEQEREVDVLWPLFSKSSGPDSWSMRLRPFFGVEVDERERRSEVDVLWPLFHREQQGETTSTRVLPLFWSRDSPEGGYNHLLPLWYSTWSPEHTTFVSPVGPVFVFERDGQWDVHVWPIFGRHDLEAGGSRIFSLAHAFWVDVGDETSGGFAAPAPLIMARWTPEATSVLAAPLLFAYHREAERTWHGSIPFWIYQQWAEDDYQLLTIPYAYTHSPETARHDLLFPLFTHEAAHDGSSRSVSLRPLFWYDRDPERAWSLLVPLYYDYLSADEETARFWTLPFAWTRTPEAERYDVLYPLISHRRAHDDSERSARFAPLFWYDRTPERTHTVVAPLFWDYQTPERRQLTTPLYVYRRSLEETRHDVLWPFFSWATSADGSETSVSIRPLLFVDSGPESTSVVALPLGYYGREGNDVQAYAIPWFYHRTQGEDVTSLAPPFYYRVKRGDRDSVHVWPFVSHYSEPDYSQWSTLWPLFAWGSGPDRSHVRALPLFVHDRDGEDTFTTVFPLYWGSQDAQRDIHVIAPSYFYVKDHEQQSETELLLPLYLLRRTPESELFSWGGLYWSYRQQDSIARMIPPLFFDFRDDATQRSTTVGFPLYWSFRDDAVGESSRVVFPFYWGFRDEQAQSETDVVFPFYWRHRAPDTSLDSVLSLYWRWRDKGSSADVLAPFYWGFSDEEAGSDTDVLFPLYWSHEVSRPERGSSSRIAFPFYWSFSRELRENWEVTSRDETDVVFPFYWRYRGPEEALDSVLGLYWRSRDHGSSADVLFPLYWGFGDEEAGSDTDVLFPLYWSHEVSRPDRESASRVAFPLYWSFSDERRDEAGTVTDWSETDAYLPFYVRQRGPEESLDTVLGLYWRSRDHGSSADVLFPLYWGFGDEAAGSDTDVLFPLYWSHEVSTPSEERTSRVVFPLYWSSHADYLQDGEVFQEQDTDVFFPFYARHRAPEESLDAVLGLYWRSRDHGSSADVLFPLYWGFSDEAAGSDTDVLFPLYWSHEVSRPDRESVTRVAFPLYWSSHQELRGADGQVSRREDTDVFFPLYWRYRAPLVEREHDVVPPLYWYFRRGDWQFRALLPLYLAQESEESALTMLGALYWSRRTGDDVVRTVLPLYWDLDPAGPDRTIHLWPLFGYHREGDYASVSTLWPLFTFGSGEGSVRYDFLWPLGTHVRDEAGVHSRFLPLYLYDSDEAGWSCDLVWPLVQLGGTDETSRWSLLYRLAHYESSATSSDFRVLQWLYRYGETEDSADHYLLPLYKYWRDGDERGFWFLWPLVDYEAQGEDSWLNVLWPLFMYESTAESTEARLFYKFYEYQERPDSGSVALNPFFAYEWSPAEDKFQLFGGLYFRKWVGAEKEGHNGFLWGLIE